MKKHIIFTFTIVLALCLFMAASAFAETQAINPGDTISGTFSKGGKGIEYSIELPSSGKLDLNAHNGADKAFTISLKDAKHFSKNLDVDPGDKAFSCDLEGGKYTLTIKGSAHSGDYSIATAFTPSNETYAEDNDSINEIRISAAIPFKEVVTGQIAENDKQDWFKVELPASGKLKVAITSEVDKVNFEVRDANDKYVTGKYVSKGSESITMQLAGGVYYVCFDQTEGYGVYTFKPTFTNANETYTYENDTVNLVRSQKAVPYRKTVIGHFALNDSADCFKVVVPKTGKYNIKLISTLGMITFNIRDDNDAYVDQIFHAKGTKTYKRTLKKGTYYFLFEQNEGLGAFKFRTVPSGVTIKKLVKASKAAKVTWTKGTGNGYQIRYSLNKNFKNYKDKNFSKIGTVSTTVKKLKSKKTYYFKIRTYVKNASGKKIWSDWSKRYSVTVK